MLKPLKTLKGSRIYYAKGGIGKKVGDKIYIHKNYALDVIPTDVWYEAQSILHDFNPGFKYNCVCYSSKENVIRFDEAPDFDTAREPHPGKMLTLNLNTFYKTMELKESYSEAIWHHKWEWVTEDYDGFNVQDSYEWSKLWLSKVNEVASGSLVKWKEQLKKVGLE